MAKHIQPVDYSGDEMKMVGTCVLTPGYAVLLAKIGEIADAYNTLSGIRGVAFDDGYAKGLWSGITLIRNHLVALRDEINARKPGGGV